MVVAKIRRKNLMQTQVESKGGLPGDSNEATAGWFFTVEKTVELDHKH